MLLKIVNVLPGLSETENRYKWFIIIFRQAYVKARSRYLMFLLFNTCVHIKPWLGLFILKGKKNVEELQP